MIISKTVELILAKISVQIFHQQREKIITDIIQRLQPHPQNFL